MESVRTEPLATAPALSINGVHETLVEMLPPAARATQTERGADRQPRDLPPSPSALDPGNNPNQFRRRTLVLIVAAVASIFAVTGAVLYTLGSTVNVQSNMPEATVALDGRTVGQTAPDGTLSFSRVRLGKHVITVRKPELGEASGNVSVTLLSRMILVKVQAPSLVSDLHSAMPTSVNQTNIKEDIAAGAAAAAPVSGSDEVALLQQLPSWVPVRNIPPQNYPPRPFRGIDACPGAGCGYGRWQATREVLLYSAVGHSQLAGRAESGETVNVPLGVVITLRPGIVRTKSPAKFGPVRIEAGDLVYTLPNRGEGTIPICYHGHLIVANHEFFDSTDQLASPITEWWVQVSKLTGETGWTKDVAAFAGKGIYQESPSATQVSPAAPADVETSRTTRIPKPTGENSGPSAAQVMEQAKSLFSARRYTEALQACERVLRTDPQNNSARQLKRQVEDTMRVLGVQ